MNRRRLLTVVGLVLTSTFVWAAVLRNDRWSPEEIATLQTLSIRELEPLPADPTNRVADDPEAVKLGQRLFFDTRLSSNGKVSCATCHIPEREFQDGTPLATGVGTTNRRTMPIASVAHSPFLFWDGRKDSLWSQALGPLESPVEHGGTRARAAREWATLDPAKRDAVTKIFVNIGKAIAAYERRITYRSSRFDEFADAVATTGSTPKNILDADEIAGLRLFIGKANCTQCHNGPLLTNNEFHNTGVPANHALPQDRGRMTGATAVLADEFNCRSKWSDAQPEQCSELDFLVTDSHELERAYKVPSLRNVAERAPYMHAGQFATLAEVLDHYNRAPAAPAGHTELEPLGLTPRELRQLEAFLRTLSED